LVSEYFIFANLLIAWGIGAFIVFPTLFFIPAPYGRYVRGEGRTVSRKLGWIVMESAAVFVFLNAFLIGPYLTRMSFVFLLLWMVHYIPRTFVYPFLQRGRSQPFPLLVVLLGLGFNVISGYLNARYLFKYSGGYPTSWLLDVRFVVGTVLFVIGYGINRHSEHILRSLREPGESGYKIPRGGLFRWVSSPHYLGEIVMWGGWALATWSLPGLTLFLWTIANLAPRAWTYHNWYLHRFRDYPAERKVLIPGVW